MESGGSRSLLPPGKLVQKKGFYASNLKTKTIWKISDDFVSHYNMSHNTQNALVLYGQAARAISTG